MRNDFGQSGAPADTRIVRRYSRKTPVNRIEARFFCEIVKAQPEIIDKVRGLALKAVQAGHRRYGMQGIVEVLRWSMIEEPGKTLGINDHMCPYLRRWVQETTPELPPNFFKFRPVRDSRSKRDREEIAIWMSVLDQIERTERAEA